MRLEGKTSLISGAGRNNGRAIALRFAEEGSDLILVAREDGEQLQKVADECKALGVRTLPLLADATDRGQVDDVVAKGLAEFGKIDAAVSVIGLRPHRKFMDYTYEESLQVRRYRPGRALPPGPGGAAQHGAESGGQHHRPGWHVGWLRPARQRAGRLVQACAAWPDKVAGPRVRQYGIRVNLLNPGSIENVRKNPEWYALTGGEPTEKKDLEGTPLRRKGTNLKVANAALFLASDESSYITGDRINCIGGRFMT